MAIQINTELKGIQVQGAYCKVKNVKLTKNSISFTLSKYANSNEVLSFDDIQYTCSYDLEGENPYKQAYEYLKTLTEYSEAIDL